MGIGKDGQKTPGYTPGVELHGRLTFFAEGCRGSLTKTLFERFALRQGVDPQTFGIGIKELWEVDPAKHNPGKVVHSVGRSEERRVGKECVSTCRSRWWPYHSNKKSHRIQTQHKTK